MIRISKIASVTVLLHVALTQLDAQSFNAGFVFQYHVLKQIDLRANSVTGTFSHDVFNVKENNWKVFSAGQSILIGMMAQMDYKKFYMVVEVSFNLNTYRYPLLYAVGPSQDEEIIFETLYMQLDVPLYVGYQFQSANLLRYSLFGGIGISAPTFIETSLEEREPGDEFLYDRYSVNDMRHILYDDRPYLNAMAGFCVHIASLAKLDVRYIHRLGSPGKIYDVKFNTIGVALTYFLPLHLTKKRLYYED